MPDDLAGMVDEFGFELALRRADPMLPAPARWLEENGWHPLLAVALAAGATLAIILPSRPRRYRTNLPRAIARYVR